KTLSLDGFFTTAISNKLRNQEIEITVFIPENTVLFMDPKLNSFISSSSRFKGKTNTNSHHYKFENHEFACLDCPKEKINLEIEDSNQTEVQDDWEIRVKEKLNR